MRNIDELKQMTTEELGALAAQQGKRAAEILGNACGVDPDRCRRVDDKEASCLESCVEYVLYCRYVEYRALIEDVMLVKAITLNSINGEVKEKKTIYQISALARTCGYFHNADTDEFSCNNGYNCCHPQQEESEVNAETGEAVFKCLARTCPLGYEADEEDFADFEIDQNEYTEGDYEEGGFVVVKAVMQNSL
jgi:hypothetical protein